MKRLSIDLETYSPLDIRKVGGYRYAENSEILLFAYAWDDKEVEIIDLARGEAIPKEVLEALNDVSVTKCAFNANFERTVLSHYLGLKGEYLSPKGWSCTMVQAISLGLPGSLDKVAKVLKLAEDKQKLSTGTALINYFSKPCKSTKINGGRTRNLPHHAEEKWEQFKEYCVRDVVVERAIRDKLDNYKLLASEQELWELDQRINDYGVAVDSRLIDNATIYDEAYKERVLDEARALTGLANPNSNVQLSGWIEQVEGFYPTSLAKDALPEVRASVKSDKVLKMLAMREMLSKTSVKKYTAMANATCRDGRTHGLLQFYGANRTGRWAGRLVQVQNLRRNDLAELDEAREFLRRGDTDAIELFFDQPMDVLSQLIRTAFVASEGNTLLVADFSAIEARVIAWLANEKWRMEVFKNGGDIYCASASQMFKVPVEKHGVNGHLRQKGKVAELACGYQGGIGALKAMGADKLGLSDDELMEIIANWRKASPNIVQLWQNVSDAAVYTVGDGISRSLIRLKHGLKFSKEKGMLFIELPSKRRLAYPRPKLSEDTKFNHLGLTYEGLELGTWRTIRSYGGKLVENIVQAIARDLLAVAMLRLSKAGYKIVMHVHDEVVIESPKKGSDEALKEVLKIMSEPVEWAKGLILTADGYITDYYRKD